MKKIDDVKSGQEVTLEILWGDGDYEMPSRVLGNFDGKLLLKPYVYNGVVVEMMSEDNEDMTINLHCIDEEGNRKVFNSVNITSETYRDDIIYEVSAGTYNSIAQSSERRSYKRTEINYPGKLITEKGEILQDVVIKDISDAGISFMISSDYRIDQRKIVLKWEDKIRGKEFNIKVHGTISRTKTEDKNTVYGCEIMEPDRDLLMYILLKRAK
ncbi:MAG: PilZ domain-containing protein [Lachnospiraceae bacterium]|nr:PilZ domain-containing protein [Lachnospiraceae bacterium]